MVFSCRADITQTSSTATSPVRCAQLMKKQLTFLSLSFFLFACSSKRQPENGQSISEIKKQTIQIKPKITFDTLNNLFNKAIIADSIEFVNGPSILYFKSGYFLTGKQKNAILIYIPDDSTFTIEIYTLSNGKWLKKFDIRNLEARTIAFNTEYKDFNFDGVKDLYIQQDASNGYVMSRGYVITINPGLNKLILHDEVRNEANLTPDPITKTVYADELIECKETLFKDVCKRAFKWRGQKLVKRDRVCPCKPFDE
jgi:hypothetical protein